MPHRESKIKGIRLGTYNNYLMAANRKICAELKKKGLYKTLGQGGLERTNIFRSFHDLPPLAKKTWRCWVVNQWILEENNLMRDFQVGFYGTCKWKQLRVRVLLAYGSVCMKCGSVDNIAVDHIKPRSLYPELKLEFNNMQVLCRSCNSSKSNRKIFDLRPKDVLDFINGKE